MLAMITVHSFFELIINLRVQMTVHEVIHMEYKCMLLANLYPVSDTWIVMIELRQNIFQVSTYFILE